MASRATAEPGKPIPLVGPSFTGSQISLARTVLEWVELRKRAGPLPPEPVPQVSCISGTALGLKPWKDLWLDKEPELTRLFGQITCTQAPFAELESVAMHYLCRPGRTAPTEPPTGHPEGRVAYLVEANSGFGEVAARMAIEKGQRHNDPPSEGLVYRFPMHIGRLAGLRSKEARERDQRLGLIQPGEGQLRATDADRVGGDLIPAADDTRTALINQRLLADYWTQIRREQVRYIWVIATDKRDVLFLLEQIQTACPDARPVVFGADMHYVHSDYLRFMRGVMVVGTYPLFPPAQRWQARGSESRRIPFPSGNAEGLYNAILATFDSSNMMTDYRSPFEGPGAKPPIWVTAVGENGEFVPLAYSTNYNQAFMVAATGTKEDTPADSPADSPFQRPFFYLVGVIALATGFSTWRVWSLNREIAPGVKGTDDRVRVPGMCAQYAVLVGIGGVLAVLPLVLAFWSARTSNPTTWANPITRIALYASVVVLALIVVRTGLYIRRQGVLAAESTVHLGTVPAYSILAPWQVVAFAVLIGGSVIGWLLADHSRLPETARYLFAERAADLYSGCSPVVPAAVIAFGLIGSGLLGLHHVRLMTRFRITAPYPPWGTHPSTGVAVQDALAVGRIHTAANEIHVRFSSLFGVFADPGRRSGTRWGRLLIWGSAGVFVTTLIHQTIIGVPLRDPILYLSGLMVATLAALAAALILRFVWRQEYRVPIATPRPTGVLLILVTGTACVIALERAQRTWESHAWNCLFATGLIALAFLTLISGYSLFVLWKQVEKITRSISVVPMVAAFDRFPDKVARVFGAYLLSGRRRTLDLTIPLHLLEQVRVSAESEAHGDRAAKGATAAVRHRPPVATGGAEEMEGTSATHLCGVAADLLTLLAPGWAHQRLPDAFGTVGAEPGKEADASANWRTLAEQFIAIMAIIFLSQYFARMRCLAYMTIVPAGTLLVAVTAYQFEPEQFLMYTAVGFAGAVISLLVWLLYRINRNELVSRATRSTPNKFQMDGAFVQNFVVFVLPLGAVVITQLAGRMRSVVEPLLGWLR